MISILSKVSDQNLKPLRIKRMKSKNHVFQDLQEIALLMLAFHYKSCISLTALAFPGGKANYALRIRDIMVILISFSTR